MFLRKNAPRVVKVRSAMPVSELDAFDMMSRFLAAEKAKQLSLDFAGETYLTSSTQTWDDLRLSCNSLLDDKDPRREPVVAWKTDAAGTPAPSEAPTTTTPVTDQSDRGARKSEKKERKEAKKAKKSAKKAKKEVKKAKKEAKKRKRESI